MAAKKVFELPYIGVDRLRDFDILYGNGGEFSVIIELLNPVVQFSASPEAYEEFHGLLTGVIKILGDGYILQKQDILYRSPYPEKEAGEYLQRQYNAHFAGRDALKIKSFLTLTRQVKRGRFYVYDPKHLRDFSTAVHKVMDVLRTGKCEPKLLMEHQINRLLRQVLNMNFSGEKLSLNNMMPSDTGIGMGDISVRCIPLVDTDKVDLPLEIGPYTELNDNGNLRGFPVDLFSFLYKVPDFETILFNQVIEIPSQQGTLTKLEVKKKRHSGIPDPANTLCVEDIEVLLKDVARNNQLLVNAHFNIVLAAKKESLQKAVNYIESSLFGLGIIPNQNAYNQLELFRTALPGNGVELQVYDWFLTTSDAALCFFFKEALPVDEPSDFLIRFTDRQGIPIAIDPCDLPMRTNRISNRNKFVCGSSGTGKSFLVNAIVEQYLLYNMDVVIVDVGHSYSGLCDYYGGKYITYSEQRPITMNPFAISEEEYNLEKKENLVTLIALLWKGANGWISTVERDVITQLISGYYGAFFQGELDANLSFNSFYDFAVAKIPIIKTEERVPFDLDEFRYVLKKFYKGGEYGTILNEPADASLFNEKFIVYEIDNVQDNKTLFPIVTLIIMDVFLQKMRHRQGQRKALILEEAWKALTSPMMAGFMLYLNKTVRKFWGEIMEVTQSLEDVLGNPILKDAIISESDTIILLDQRKFRDNYEGIAKLLSLNETEQRKIFTINQLDNKDGRSRFKEFYMRRGAVGEVYGLETSLAQYLTYTTEKPEKRAIQTYVKAYGSYPAGIDAFIQTLHTTKLSMSELVSRVNEVGNILN
ncbi:TraG family conjugative transposon ATPase [Mucilaginibacter sp. dw_454]|uniref:TraG family conjugative transposon ATPase n=1 Tax=Mucilaginibacter sp. dw_454 TaxID=2720079 RepID=UPI001BD5D443|nr:TraG family conjugative transposon ATPase [Mucilaginibacter sp. dw_454]